MHVARNGRVILHLPYLPLATDFKYFYSTNDEMKVNVNTVMSNMNICRMNAYLDIGSICIMDFLDCCPWL